MNRERLIVWTVGILLVAASVGVGFVGTPYSATPDAVETVERNPAVTVSSLGDGYVLSPGDAAVGQDGDAATALVFYPGGRVHPNAYVPVLAPVVERTGVTVFIPRPPLTLAVFDVDRAGQISTEHPEIEQWYVGGHSLGGAMACRYVTRHPDQVSGLVLFASYCDRDVRETDVRVLSVRGERDGVLDADAYRAHRGNLPGDGTVEVTIGGMNHSQFGAYGGQTGDARATIPNDVAHEALQDALVEFLRSNDVDPDGEFVVDHLARTHGETDAIERGTDDPRIETGENVRIETGESVRVEGLCPERTGNPAETDGK